MLYLPRNVLIERGSIEKIQTVVSGLGSRPIVVADRITQDIGGKKIAERINCDLVLIDGPSMEEVKKIEGKKTDCIVSCGGGAVIDVCKLAAHRKNIPFISFPTSCANDGIASENVSLTENGKYVSLQAKAPYAVIVDLDIIINSPYKKIASGAADVLSKYTALFDWRLAKDHGEEYSDTIANLSLMCADSVSSSINEIKNKTELGISNLLWALLFSGMAMTLHGSSRPASGAEHMFSHALDRIGRFGLHGEQVGVGSIFFSCLQGGDWKKIRAALENLGAPTKAEQINVSKEVFVQAMLEAKNIRKRYTIMDEKLLTKELVLKVGKETGII